MTIMGFEVTTGFLMCWGGLAGIAVTVIGSIIYFSLSARKAKKLLKKLSEEDF